MRHTRSSARAAWAKFNLAWDSELEWKSLSGITFRQGLSRAVYVLTDEYIEEEYGVIYERLRHI